MLSQAIHIELKDADSFNNQEPSPLPSRAQACGKAIVLGEHAVIYGAHAVAIPLPNMRLEIVLEALTHKPLKRSRTAKTTSSENFQNVLCDALRLLNLKSFPLKVEGHSNILFGAGLGASAALSVCILRALSQFVNKPLDPSELASLANQLEKRFHGTPSGLDATTVAFEKPLLFKKGEAPQALHVGALSLDKKKYPWNFAIIDSGTRSPTLTMVQQSAPYFQGAEGEERVRRFDELALQTSQALEMGNLHTVQNSMEKAHHLLHEVGVVPPLLMEMVERAKTCGALSAKVTGAGGGGCILSLLDPRSAEETIRQLREMFGSSKVYPIVLIGS